MAGCAVAIDGALGPFIPGRPGVGPDVVLCPPVLCPTVTPHGRWRCVPGRGPTVCRGHPPPRVIWPIGGRHRVRHDTPPSILDGGARPSAINPARGCRAWAPRAGGPRGPRKDTVWSRSMPTAAIDIGNSRRRRAPAAVAERQPQPLSLHPRGAPCQPRNREKPGQDGRCARRAHHDGAVPLPRVVPLRHGAS